MQVCGSNSDSPQGVMVWAAIDDKGALVFKRCPPKMKAVDYRGVLGSALPFIRRRSSSWKFQQDGAPVHRARATFAWLNTNSVRMLNKGQWPAHSPDMNPIEHLWPMVSTSHIHFRSPASFLEKCSQVVTTCGLNWIRPSNPFSRPTSRCCMPPCPTDWRPCGSRGVVTHATNGVMYHLCHHLVW